MTQIRYAVLDGQELIGIWSDKECARLAAEFHETAQAVIYNRLTICDIMPLYQRAKAQDYNPRHVPAIPLKTDYIAYHDHVVCLGMYTPGTDGYSYLFHRTTNRRVFPEHY